MNLMKSMRFLVIGLGSMGKRRVRCLKALGIPSDQIVGYDPRGDRRQEAASASAIPTVDALTDAIYQQADALIVSTPPADHYAYLSVAVKHLRPVFVEASVLLEGLPELAQRATQNKVFIAPSCTLKFHPAIQDIKRLLTNGGYGRVTNFSYHSGQYLPDWHPWEAVADYYVGRKDTSGGREIVPFELTWLCDLFGLPQRVKCLYGSTMNVGADIDDTYALTMQFREGFGQLLVDVVARSAVRSFVLNLERAQIVWNWNQPWVDLYEPEAGRWIRFNQPEGTSAKGYNKNIIEEMYISELRAFIDGISDATKFPNSLDNDIAILKILHAAETDAARN